ncbi:MAG: FAD-dependent oxidoreductase [Burkholderiales bacterium]|nr:FAD-dependent oxidoreductase [Burkholderiales bacterium]
MGRTAAFRRLLRALRAAHYCDARGLSTRDGLAQLAGPRPRAVPRRAFLARAGQAALLAGAWSATPFGGALAAPKPPAVDVAIVGAGIAGLACADTLRARGIHATVYEAGERVGGRIWSMGGAFPAPVPFPGQVLERGGELIDTTHLTMKAYAKEFGLALEEMAKEWLPGESRFHLGGSLVPEADVVDAWRELVGRLRPDLAQLSNYVDAYSHTAFDRAIDATSLADYLAARGADPLIVAALDVAFTTEYGIEIGLQSALSLLFFMHIDRRSRFQPFGVFSDERYHCVGGNQQIPEAIAARLARPVAFGQRLLAVRKRSDGRLTLTLDRGGRTATATHDAVVLALPFHLLRDVAVDASVGLPPGKRHAIDHVIYGDNAKMHVAMNARFWGAHGSNGEVWADLPDVQLVWEPNPSLATATRAVLLDYSGGDRAAGLKASKAQDEAKRFLTGLDRALPGALANARRDARGQYVAHLQHWPSDPLAQGAYTANQPGYFTSILGNEAPPVDNLFFAGETTDSFYEWQGFMEGGANSGIRAANELLALVK